MEPAQQETSNLTPPPQPQAKQPKLLMKLLVVVGILLGFVLSGMGGYYLGTQKETDSDQNQGESSQQPEADQENSTDPAQDNFLGITEVSFAVSGKDVLVRSKINLIDKIARYPNSDLRVIEKVYSQESSPYDNSPKLLDDVIVTDYSWTDLVTREVDNKTNAKDISVADNLFSLKRIPDSDSFLFVVSWLRRNSGLAEGIYTNERVLYLYNSTSGETIEVMVFKDDDQDFSYPKIDKFSKENRYVSLLLFSCWGCGGHQPETLLLDLQSLETRNIGKVKEFAWTQNGDYQYKDYVVIECDELSPGECTQDTDTLPLKTGSVN